MENNKLWSKTHVELESSQRLTRTNIHPCLAKDLSHSNHLASLALWIAVEFWEAFMGQGAQHDRRVAFINCGISTPITQFLGTLRRLANYVAH